MKLYNTISEIDAAVAKFHKAGQSVQTEAHKLACSVLRHVGEHGDIRVVAKFLQSFTEMSRVNAVRAWFEKFGPIAFDGNDPIYVRGGKTRLGEAMDVPFWKATKEQAYKPIDVSEALDALIKKLVKDTRKTGISHAATIAALRAAPVNGMLMLTHQPN